MNMINGDESGDDRKMEITLNEVDEMVRMIKRNKIRR